MKSCHCSVPNEQRMAQEGLPKKDAEQALQKKRANAIVPRQARELQASQTIACVVSGLEM